MKLNVDGALFTELDKSGVGAVLRDHLGSGILAVCHVVYGVCSVDTIEVFAILRRSLYLIWLFHIS